MTGDERSTLPDPDGSTPLQALDRELLPALLRPPCTVSFSGGRDSSAVLAAAVKLAKREGLPPPIPVTNVFPEVREADEQAWQQHVVRHLGLTEWLRLQHTDELDLLGPYAQRVLLRHGLVWPFNVHFHLPLLDAARGGSMLTGIGGDEIFGAAQRERTAALIAGQAASTRPVTFCVWVWRCRHIFCGAWSSRGDSRLSFHGCARGHSAAFAACSPHGVLTPRES